MKTIIKRVAPKTWIAALEYNQMVLTLGPFKTKAAAVAEALSVRTSIKAILDKESNVYEFC